MVYVVGQSWETVLQPVGLLFLTTLLANMFDLAVHTLPQSPPAASGDQWGRSGHIFGRYVPLIEAMYPLTETIYPLIGTIYPLIGII